MGYYQSVLESAGIPCFIRNYNDPYNSLTCTLCVTYDEDYERALETLRLSHPEPPSNAPDWTCPKCGENVPGSFDVCWKCGAERPA